MKKEKCKKTTGWNNENNAKKSLIEIQKRQKTENLLHNQNIERTGKRRENRTVQKTYKCSDKKCSFRKKMGWKEVWHHTGSERKMKKHKRVKIKISLF